MKAVSQGDFEQHLETNSRIAEIGESYQSFNVMTKELRATEMLQMDFVSNVSHEFKTPINAIEGYTMLLQGDELSQEQEGYVEKILFNTQKMCIRDRKKVATSQFHDYYEAQLQMHLICLRYFFEFTDMQGEKVYYGNYEFDKECITNRDRMFDCPQNLREEEMFEVPQWAANKVVYQIFPSRFATTQPVDKELWYKAPITPMDDLHGNLRGIIEHLDYIKDLGIDVVYLTPIFKSNSCHKYDTIDYYPVSYTHLDVYKRQLYA